MIRILKFSATWCSKCTDLSKRLEGFELPIEEVDFDMNPDLIEKYGVRSLPAVVFVDKDGEYLGRIVRAAESKNPIDQDQIRDKYNKILESYKYHEDSQS